MIPAEILKESDSQHSDDKAIVCMTDVYKTFGTNRVLKGVTFSLAKGENLVVIGKSGCGKSVLAKCIIGLVYADGGSIRVFGEEITGMGRKQMNMLRSRIGFLFQGNALYDSMSVADNLLFALRRREKGYGIKEMNKRVDEVLENVKLPGVAKLMPAELSGGMKKRIGLARALILKPQLMLYDEPTTGLDPITSREISMLMLDMQSAYGMSSIIISHDVQCVRMVSNRVIALIDGICYATGTCDALSRSDDDRVNSFFK